MMTDGAEDDDATMIWIVFTIVFISHFLWAQCLKDANSSDDLVGTSSLGERFRTSQNTTTTERQTRFPNLISVWHCSAWLSPPLSLNSIWTAYKLVRSPSQNTTTTNVDPQDSFSLNSVWPCSTWLAPVTYPSGYDLSLAIRS